MYNMKFNEAINEARLFTKWTGKGSGNIYDPDWTEYAHKDMKKLNKNVHIKDYKKTLKSGGKKPYLSWVNKVRVKI